MYMYYTFTHIKRVAEPVECLGEKTREERDTEGCEAAVELEHE